jgi:hypothetical protein
LTNNRDSDTLRVVCISAAPPGTSAGRPTTTISEASATDVCRRQLLKYTGTDKGPLAEELLQWARSGEMSVVELTPLGFAAFAY